MILVSRRDVVRRYAGPHGGVQWYEWRLVIICGTVGAFFVANGITDREKQAALLSVMGATTYWILYKMVSLNKPGKKMYAALVEALSQQFKPKSSEINEHFKFHSHTKKPGESIIIYVAEVCSFSEFCDFGDTLEVMIRDRLVCGIIDGAIQKQLQEPKLTYAKVVEMVQATETVVQSM